jgi:hypothetical protein
MKLAVKPHEARRGSGNRLVCPSLAASFAAIVCAVDVSAQVPSPPVKPIVEQAEQHSVAACLEPPPIVRLEDYDGPFYRAVGTFSRKLERKSIHESHYKPEAALCTLETSEKLRLFAEDTIDPVSLLTVGFNAALDQAQNVDRTFGPGGRGFEKRLLAAFEAQTSSRFFSEFAYPTIFSEDPRYYRLGTGTVSQRLLHALGHTVVAHSDNGGYMFNFSEVLGTATGAALSYAYHPGTRVGVRPAAEGAAFSIASDAGFDLLREFWPEVARKLRMPFRGVANSEPNQK